MHYNYLLSNDENSIYLSQTCRSLFEKIPTIFFQIDMNYWSQFTIDSSINTAQLEMTERNTVISTNWPAFFVPLVKKLYDNEYNTFTL